MFSSLQIAQCLMCAYVALILTSPMADSNPALGALIAFLTLLVMLAGASYMANRRIFHVLGLPLACLWIFARTLEAVGDSRHVYTQLAPVAGLALSCVILCAILDRFDSVPQITTGVISEAFICYLVLATAFSQAYCIMDRFLGNAFNQVIPAWQTSAFVYFSMITLSTVGYGGIVPVSPYVRLVAALEGMIGVFFIAVVVARLVSAYVPRRKAPRAASIASVGVVSRDPGGPDRSRVSVLVFEVPTSTPAADIERLQSIVLAHYHPGR